MTSRVLLLCCLALSVSGKSLRYPRIIDGEETTIEKFPHSVEVFSRGFVCGGSIISPEWVITAAHCAPAEAVVAGQTNPFNSTKKWAVSQSITHPQYNNPPYAHDIALLKLKEKLPLDGIIMKAVKLADANPKTGELIDIAGWGRTDPAGINGLPQTLRTSENAVFSFDDCKKIFKEELFDSDICLKDPKGIRTGCNGDSGSAAVDKNGYQVGITSRGDEVCGQLHMPVVYTSIAHPEHRQFIKTHTGL